MTWGLNNIIYNCLLASKCFTVFSKIVSSEIIYKYIELAKKFISSFSFFFLARHYIQLLFSYSTHLQLIDQVILTSDSKDVNLLSSIFFFWESMSLNISVVDWFDESGSCSDVLRLMLLIDPFREPSQCCNGSVGLVGDRRFSLLSVGLTV